jgi:glycosyltransferase involved in cell wall biosynthesis
MAYEIIVIIDSIENSNMISDLINKRYHGRNITVIINSENIGVSASRNKGLAASRFDFFTIIDQDDFVDDRYFSVLECELAETVPILILNGFINYVNEDIYVPIYAIKPRFEFKNILLKNTFIYTPGLVVFNARFVNKANFFIDSSDKYKGCDDWAAYLNLLLKESKLAYNFVAEKIFYYCLHSENYSNDKKQMILSSIAVLNYLKQNNDTNSEELLLINKSLRLQEFYFAKEIEKMSALQLFAKFPNSFIYHYCASLFQLDQVNKLFLKLNYRWNKTRLYTNLR